MPTDPLLVEHSASAIQASLLDSASAMSVVAHTQLTTFDELVEELRRLLGFTSGINSADVDVNEIMAAMDKYISDRSQWVKYALADQSRNYTRNGVDDMNDKANLLILVWNPGKSSLIHDHADAHCIMKILEGELVEKIYKWPEGDKPQKMTIERRTAYKENEVTYISDQIGLHKISNESLTKPAVSLHLYTPPWAAKYGCLAFDEMTGKKVKVNLSNLYSDKGIIKNTRADTA